MTAAKEDTGSDREILDRIEAATDVVFDPGTDAVAFDGSKTDTDHYVDLVTYLFEEGHVTPADLPISGPRAQTRYVLNTADSHEDHEMLRPVEIAEGVFLETNHDTESKKRYAKLLLREYVLDADG